MKRPTRTTANGEEENLADLLNEELNFIHYNGNGKKRPRKQKKSSPPQKPFQRMVGALERRFQLKTVQAENIVRELLEFKRVYNGRFTVDGCQLLKRRGKTFVRLAVSLDGKECDFLLQKS